MTTTCKTCKGTGKIPHDESDEEREQRCEEMLTDIYGEVDVCGYKYDAGYLLRLVDETAFNCAASEMDDLPEDDCEDCDGIGEVEDNEEGEDTTEV